MTIATCTYVDPLEKNMHVIPEECDYIFCKRETKNYSFVAS